MLVCAQSIGFPRLVTRIGIDRYIFFHVSSHFFVFRCQHPTDSVILFIFVANQDSALENRQFSSMAPIVTVYMATDGIF
jgi:hypothetical protein